MRRLIQITTLLFLLSSISLLAQETRLHGTVTSATGESFVTAHVRLVPQTASSPWQSEVFAPEFRVAEVAEDGSWSMEGVEPGYYELLVTAVDHDYVRSLLPVDGSDPEIGLDVRLPLPVYVESLAMGVVGPFNNFGRMGAEGFTKDTLGRYVADFQSPLDTVPLQVRGIAELPGRIPTRYRRMSPALARRDIPGPEPSPIARFEYDGEGDYLAVIPVVDGRVRVLLDLPHVREIVESTAGDSGAVIPHDAWLADFYRLADRLTREDMAVERATTYLRHPTMEETEREYAIIEAADRKRRDEMIALMRSEEAPLPLRRYAAVQLAIVEKDWMREYRPWHDPDTILWEEIGRFLPETSPWWGIDPYLAYTLHVTEEIGSEEWNRHVGELQKSTDAWALKGLLLAMRTLDAQGSTIGIAYPIRETLARRRRPLLVTTGVIRDPDTELFEELFAQLAEEYPDFWNMYGPIGMSDSGR